MQREVRSDSDRGVSISLSIPVTEPDLFKHKATNDILSFLSRHRFERFSLGEVARQLEYASTTVGRAVDPLVANDLVIEESDGNKRLVRINRARLSIPDDPLLQIPQPEFHEPVQAAVEQLQQSLENVIGIVLYGSVARGEVTSTSGSL